MKSFNLPHLATDQELVSICFSKHNKRLSDNLEAMKFIYMPIEKCHRISVLTPLCHIMAAWQLCVCVSSHGQIDPRTNRPPSFLHRRANRPPSICTGGQTDPRRFAQADKQTPVDLHRQSCFCKHNYIFVCVCC